MTMKLRIFALLLVILLSISACDGPIPYQGDNPWYAATAIYSVPGRESDQGDQYIALEQDAYGRIMFAAIVRYGWLCMDSTEESMLAVMIMQGRDESEVWFYREKNYLATLIPTNYTDTLTEEFILQYFNQEQIETLKTANDWGKTPSDGQCIRVPLVVDKKKIATSDMYRQAEKEIGSNIRLQFFRETANGIQVYFVTRIDEKQSRYSWYLIQFDNDGIVIPDSVVGIPKNIESLPANVNAYWQRFVLQKTGGLF